MYCPDHWKFIYVNIYCIHIGYVLQKHWLHIFSPLLAFSYCTGPFKEMHQEFQQITEPSVFDQQIFRRGLLQRNNFPLHFLSWTKTPLKWMAFAHSLWPQLAVLLHTLVLWPQNRQTEDEGQWRGLTQQVHTWNDCNYCPHPISTPLSDLTRCWLIYLSFFLFSKDGRSPQMTFSFSIRIKMLKLRRCLILFFPSLFCFNESE